MLQYVLKFSAVSGLVSVVYTGHRVELWKPQWLMSSLVSCCGVPQALGTKPVLLWSCVAPAARLSLNLQVSHAVLLLTAFGG